ncbi:MAG: PD-(D/E)XK nuclease family transposase [Bacilli bacterium]
MDFVFVHIFGAEENKNVLLTFVNAVFESTGAPHITSTEILNLFLDKDALHDQVSVLDGYNQYFGFRLHLFGATSSGFLDS